MSTTVQSNFTVEREEKLAEDSAEMVLEMDAYVRTLYAPENVFGFLPHQLEDPHIYFFVVREEGKPIACAGIKVFDENPNDLFTEAKRMYVRPGHRGKGLAKMLLQKLEALTRELGFTVIRLETGIYQSDAIHLYEKQGYMRRGVYSDYRETTENLFYEKVLP